MLINLKYYHRPRDLQNALYLLRRPEPRTVPLAGGSRLIGSGSRSVEAVVDLQGLGLRYVRKDQGSQTLRLGAMTTLADVSRSEVVHRLYRGMIADAAHRSAGSVLRNQATIGGAIAVGGPADELLVALLACDAEVTVHAPAAVQMPLSEFLPRRAELSAAHALITEVAVGLPQTETGSALQRIARTPADSPIICAAAILTFADASCTGGRLALGGVADTPCRLPQIEGLLADQQLTTESIQAIAYQVSALVDPPGDHLASAAYRKAMAGLLSGRAMQQAMRSMR